MSSKGWVSLHRSMQDHWIWKDDREFSRSEAWIYLIMAARHDREPKTIMIKDKSLTCHRGESLRSLETLSKAWNWNRSKVRRFLKLLEKENMIRHASETVTSRISICNYDTYQSKEHGSETAIETQVKRIRNTSETHSTINNNVNNENNENKALVDLAEPNATPADDLVLTGLAKSEAAHGVCPYKQIVGAYNEILGTAHLPLCKIATPSRKAALRATWAFFNYDADAFIGYFKKVRSSDFLCSRGKNNFQATFDWLLKQKNMIKILEGNYHND